MQEIVMDVVIIEIRQNSEHMSNSSECLHGINIVVFNLKMNCQNAWNIYRWPIFKRNQTFMEMHYLHFVLTETTSKIYPTKLLYALSIFTTRAAVFTSL